MAYLQYETITQTTWGRWRAAGLQYPSNQYGGFRICLYTSYSAASSDSDGTGSYSQRLSFTSSSTSTTSDWTTNSFGQSPRTPLKCGTTYYAKGFAQWNTVWYPVTTSITSGKTSACPALSTPTLHTLSSTSTTIYLRINPVANATGYVLVCGGVSRSQSGTDYTFTGLSPSTSYGVRWKAFDGLGNYSDSPYSSYIYFSTKAAYPNPGDWNWTSAEITAMTSTPVKGLFSVLSVARWNSFLQHVNNVTDFYYANTSNRLPSYIWRTSSDNLLYASHWNLVANKVHAMAGSVSTAALNRGSGDIVYGWFFTHLRDRLNTIT